jgi:hypothetical protein
MENSMHHFSVRRRALFVVGVSCAALTAACEDKRVKGLDTGITRDSAVSVISHDLKPGSGSDSFPNVYKRDKYLINSKHIEVLYFTPNNEKAGKDTVPLKKLTPLVFVDYKLVGRGWDFWDSVRTANKIPIEKR